MKKNTHETSITENNGEILLKIFVKPNSKKTETFIDFGGELSIKVKSPPTKGKANNEIEKFIKKKCGASASIVAGEKSKTKIIRIIDYKGDIEKLRKTLFES